MNSQSRIPRVIFRLENPQPALKSPKEAISTFIECIFLSCNPVWDRLSSDKKWILKITVGPRTTLILGTRRISVFRKQCIVGYYIGTSKTRVSAKFLQMLYTIKSVHIEFLEPIKNGVSAKSVRKEAVYNEALL